MNRLEIDVLKLIASDIWGGESAAAADPPNGRLTAVALPVPIPGTVPRRPAAGGPKQALPRP
jgi:hypothetical protein